MAMRTNCRFYESRTDAGGEVVRKCRLDLAPEAPWRCPDDCARFEVRRIDVGWQVGKVDAPAEEPGHEPEGEDVAALLDAAEDILNEAGPRIRAEVDAEREAGRRRRGVAGWFRRRRR